MTTTSEITGRFPLGDRAVNRMGFGGMKLTGRRLMGPPADPEAALAVLRRAVELGSITSTPATTSARGS
jgi:pyridoxine 4-dehydrogenase